MFTFGSNQDAAPKEDPSKPAAANWTQLVQIDEPPQKIEKTSVYDCCNTVVSSLHDEDAKELVKALVFLTSRSTEL